MKVIMVLSEQFQIIIIFVYILCLNITGLMPMDPNKLLDYHPGDPINVKIKEFEVQDGKDAFKTTRKGRVVICNTRPVFELAQNLFKQKMVKFLEFHHFCFYILEPSVLIIPELDMELSA